MDNFIVSARKYRPATFATVVGQAAITNTLKNAIKNQQVAQAFLFTGPRGVGKTTCARILAKTINCTAITPEGEACDTCTSCVSFNRSASFNIFELDAASNNTVDDIRSLVDQVRIPPQHGYKVYIVDEVHMLSTAAFNAFLKTLEEPPAYAKFILATTEKHKILPTILSRCQIFDFRRISVDDIAQHLDYVAKSENITAEPEALHIIAQKADGGLRDALSMFDQLVSYAGNQLTYKQVIENLNVLDYEYYFKITDYLLNANISNALITFNEIMENGFEGQHFITGLGQHLRNILVSKDTVTLKLLETSNTIKEQYFNQAAKCSIPYLLKALEITNDCDINYKTSNNKKLHIEIALMQLCRLSMPAEQVEKPIQLPPLKTVQSPPTVKEPQTDYSPRTEPTKVDSAPSTSALPNTQEPKSTPAREESTKSEPPSALITEVMVAEQKPVTTSVAKPELKRPATYSSVNIGDLMAGITAPKPKEVETTDDTPGISYGSQQLSQSDLDKEWPAMVNQIAAEFPLLHSTLLWKAPQLNDDLTVMISIGNPLQQDEVMKFRGEITQYLRKKFKNDTLTVTTLMIEEEVGTRRPYTDTEKFEYLANRVPQIRELKDQLGLELDM